jgi:hypothetical protein
MGDEGTKTHRQQDDLINLPIKIRGEIHGEMDRHGWI